MKLNFNFSGKQVKELLIFSAVVTVVIFVMASSGADKRKIKNKNKLIEI